MIRVTSGDVPLNFELVDPTSGRAGLSPFSIFLDRSQQIGALPQQTDNPGTAEFHTTHSLPSQDYVTSSDLVALEQRLLTLVTNGCQCYHWVQIVRAYLNFHQR